MGIDRVTRALAAIALLLAAPAMGATLPIRWTVPAHLESGCRASDSTAHSWPMALVYRMPRKSPWTPLAQFWPYQVPVLVDSAGPFRPGSVAVLDVPELPEGWTYMVASRNSGGESCLSNPVAGWRP